MVFAEKEVYTPIGDPKYAHPVVDAAEEKVRQNAYGETVPYLYVHGYFEGTGLKFMFAIAPKETFRWRFFQHLSPFPGPDEELAAVDRTGEEDFIAFAVTHGSAYVECNMGSRQIFSNPEDPRDIYRSNAAVAEYFRTFVQELWGAHRVYGYAFGGSGGGYKTMSCIENTSAFDGAVPYVIGSPMSLPNCLTILAYGQRVLRRSWQKITDALEPGGSGDMYAGLTQDEAEALHEVISLGIPPRMLSSFGWADDGSYPVLLPGIKGMDPAFFTDFWTKEGYAGTDPDSNSVRDRIHLSSSVVSAGYVFGEKVIPAHDDRNGTDTAWTKMISDATGGYIDASEVPEGDDLYFNGCEVHILSGKAEGKVLHLAGVEGNRLLLGAGFGVDDYQEILDLLEEGDELLIDNSDYIAGQCYHRYQMPDDPSFHAWDQYKNEDGTPKFQTRPLICYLFTTGGCGSVQDGKIQGKVIVVNNLMDTDFPWQADWYRRKVEEVYGTEAASEIFRVYYNDNAPHGDVNEAGDMLRIVSYLGMLRQALLDLSAWVEEDAKPSDCTGYDLVDNQIILQEKAQDRKGLQAVFDLRVLDADGHPVKAVKARAGEPVTFRGTVSSYVTSGCFESVDWAFEGDKNYPDQGGEITTAAENDIEITVITKQHVFAQPGTYYVSCRIITNRTAGDAYTRLRNLDRVRVDVC